jgi:hypothetical protein
MTEKTLAERGADTLLNYLKDACKEDKEHDRLEAEAVGNEIRISVPNWSPFYLTDTVRPKLKSLGIDARYGQDNGFYYLKIDLNKQLRNVEAMVNQLEIALSDTTAETVARQKALTQIPEPLSAPGDTVRQGRSVFISPTILDSYQCGTQRN